MLKTTEKYAKVVPIQRKWIFGLLLFFQSAESYVLLKYRTLLILLGKDTGFPGSPKKWKFQMYAN
jgi:hypothetical protein